jgi:hypothetical protein
MFEFSKTPPSKEAVNNPRLRALLRYWNEKRGERRMPPRDAIDPLEIPRLLAISLLADASLPYPRIRLLGTDTTTAYGAETRGWTVDRFEFGLFAPAWIEAFSIVTCELTPAFAAGSYSSGAQYSLVETVLLPLSENGESVSHIFGGLLITPSQQNPLTVTAAAATYVCQLSASPAARNTDCRRG